MTRHTVLIVEGDRNTRNLLVEVFSRGPYRVISSSSPEEAAVSLGGEKVDVVISDEEIPGVASSPLSSLLAGKFPLAIRIILTGRARLEAAMGAINRGEIYRFFTKPCNMFDLASTVRQALQHRKLKEENEHLLKLLERQSSVINEIERRYPGITKVRKNAEGVVIMDDDTAEPKWDQLFKRICTLSERKVKAVAKRL